MILPEPADIMSMTFTCIVVQMSENGSAKTNAHIVSMCTGTQNMYCSSVSFKRSPREGLMHSEVILTLERLVHCLGTVSAFDMATKELCIIEYLLDYYC